MTAELFDPGTDALAAAPLALEPGACVLRGFAFDRAAALRRELDAVLAAAPLRHLVTPGGKPMSVATTNCGALGWVSDRAGYRYTASDPLSGRAWPPMPPSFYRLAVDAAARAGIAAFAPDACLINRYVPGARLTLHQDRDERRMDQPIVSVSLGLPAVFLWGGPKRSDRARRVPLVHGDVVVWGGPARLHHHGVLPLAEGEHPFMGACRINLTFRCAG
ncbi:DNA oxidative demethylase AlkB [Xenophilus azovorans]|uniref:DNA oxidative demethylase AlkB n=1 Tax=Xenophilus azovorans TaxID=151755 RepID=UPI0005720476|nr:DNA oxidative demethylase AlkB [Xenophilus azovorans]